MDSVYVEKVVHPSWEILSITVPVARPSCTTMESIHMEPPWTKSFTAFQLHLLRKPRRDWVIENFRGKMEVKHSTRFLVLFSTGEMLMQVSKNYRENGPGFENILHSGSSRCIRFTVEITSWLNLFRPFCSLLSIVGK